MTWHKRAGRTPATNHFELFDLPVTFAVDPKRLAERYRDLQALTEPLRLALVEEPQETVEPQVAARVAEAYRTLTDPLKRATYLLGLHGDYAAPVAGIGTDGTLLMEQMELRQIITEAQHRPNPRAAVAAVLTQLAERSAALDKELQGLFAEPSAENLESAREIVRTLQFLAHCGRDAETLSRTLGVH